MLNLDDIYDLIAAKEEAEEKEEGLSETKEDNDVCTNDDDVISASRWH